MALELFEKLLQPLYYFIDPAKRIWWPYLLVSFVFSVIIIKFKKSSQITLADFFSKKGLLHPSSLVDLKLFFFNQWFYMLLLSPVLIEQLELISLLSAVLKITNILRSVSVPSMLVSISYAFVLFICTDFSRFFLHWCMHKFNFLWKFHQVHHSAEVLTPMTVYRSHPVEMILYKLRGLFVVSIVTAIFYTLFKNNLSFWNILGVNVFGFIFNMCLANLRHSPVWIGFGLFEHVFISPAQHQMHHSRASALGRNNLGSCLAFWDKCFGSWMGSNQSEPILYGVSEKYSNHKPTKLLSALLLKK